MLFAKSLATFAVLLVEGLSFPAIHSSHRSFLKTTTTGYSTCSPLFASESDDALNDLLMTRFPTSVDDQIRQASAALQRASSDGIHRHSVRLLLPVIGATELDDWPGGARQMMEAARPLMQRVLENLGALTISTSMLDSSDGVYALFSQAKAAKDDACTVLLPSSDSVTVLQGLEAQVGPKRNLILVNAQWKRRTDFGFFGGGDQVAQVETFVPTFSCTNLMVEGDQVRVLRSYPGPWRVFLRQNADANKEGSNVVWTEIGQKEVQEDKPLDFDQDPANKRDGGKLFDYGQPSYRECETMIMAMDGYRPKSVTERAAAAITFIKDTL